MTLNSTTAEPEVSVFGVYHGSAMNIHLDNLKAQDVLTLLHEYSDPAICAGGGDPERAAKIQREILPALRRACHEYGIAVPDWLSSVPTAAAPVVSGQGKDEFEKGVMSVHGRLRCKNCLVTLPRGALRCPACREPVVPSKYRARR